jgi:hypothetical protein
MLDENAAHSPTAVTFRNDEANNLGPETGFECLRRVRVQPTRDLLLQNRDQYHVIGEAT